MSLTSTMDVIRKFFSRRINTILLILGSLMAACIQTWGPALKDRRATLPTRFPERLNLLIYNATATDFAHHRLASFLAKSLPNAQVDRQNDWQGKWVMKRTRIYYLGDGNLNVANTMRKTLGSSVQLVSYDEQLQHGRALEDKPGGDLTRVFNIDPQRDLVIFIGSDYEDVFESMKAGDELQN